jgi:hypothetical protein
MNSERKKCNDCKYNIKPSYVTEEWYQCIKGFEVDETGRVACILHETRSEDSLT